MKRIIFKELFEDGQDLGLNIELAKPLMKTGYGKYLMGIVE